MLPSVFKFSELEPLAEVATNLRAEGAAEDLLAHRPFRNLAVDPRLSDIVRTVHGGSGWPVRGLFLERAPQKPWTFGWHQNKHVAVREKLEVPGYTNWEVKDGYAHCQPPDVVLNGMLTLRISIDNNDAENGPLRVVPGSHTRGILSEAEITDLDTTNFKPCLTTAGDVVVMHPLLVHAASPATAPATRRIIHFEYTTRDIDLPLIWAYV